MTPSGAIICFCLALLTPVSALAEDTLLRFHPEAGAGSLYSVALAARLDSPLGRDVPVSGVLDFSFIPEAPEDSGLLPVRLCVQRGVLTLMGQDWDFSDQALAWKWCLDERWRFGASGDRVRGTLAVLELFLRFLFGFELPADPVPVGGSWLVEHTQEAAEGGTVSLKATYALESIETDASGSDTARISGEMEIPVDASLIGTHFAGAFRGHSSVSLDLASGNVLAISVTGSAELLADDGALGLVLREVALELRRTGEAGETEEREWEQVQELRRGLSESTLTDAILNANVSRYLRDDWRIFFPVAGNTASDGVLLGTSVLGRYRGDYLYSVGGSYGFRSGRGAYQLSVTRGYPIQPHRQQFVVLSRDSERTFVQIGASHYWGKRLGPTGIPRNRLTLSASSAGLGRGDYRFGTTGRADYVGLGYTRFRSGQTTGKRCFDWDLGASLRLGTRAVGGGYSFTQLAAGWRGFVHYGAQHTLATRIHLEWCGGNPPDQLRTALVDRDVLRGFDITNAPLVTTAITGSVEYRFRLGSTPFLDDLGLRDWWASVFVDAGIGANRVRDLPRSALYANVGITARARITYAHVPVYLWVAAAWPVGRGRSDARLTAGIDWAF